MGKAEFMTPKAIANKMKAKGLQKLRWYCQLCNKQCRDENGFKCHSDSEGHKRQLGLFASRPGKFLDTFSHEFEKTFLDELKRRFGSKRVHANLVYNEYIRDRHHTHMNSTVWTTLSGFVRHLGKTGKCAVDETPKGWYIAYINRDPEVIARQEKLAKKERMDVSDEERTRLQIEKRLYELAKLGMEPPSDFTEQADEDTHQFDIDQPHETIKFSLRGPGIVKTEPGTPSTEVSTTTTSTTPSPTEVPTTDATTPTVKSEPEENDDSATRDVILSNSNSNSNSNSSSSTSSISSPSTPSTTTSTPTPSSSSAPPPSTPSGTDSKVGIKLIKTQNPFELAAKSAKENKEKDSKEKDSNKRKKSAMEELRESEEREREKRNRRDWWVTPGIVVKIMNKTLADGKYYKVKGVVVDVIDKYIAQVKVLDFGDILKLDQSQLETVIPQIGGKVKMVNGAWRGETAVLQALDVDKFSAKVKLTSGSSSGKIIPAVPYEDLCKTAAQ